MSESKKEKEGFIMMNKMIGLRIVVLLILICLMILPTAFAETELAKGSNGVEVSILQSRLNLLGYDVGRADGDYGGKTYDAIAKFQTENELTVTGIADNITQNKIRSLLDIMGKDYYVVNNGALEGKVLYGFADESGAVVIPCEWDYASEFSEGLAAVNRDGKWGYINTEGELIIPCEWNNAQSFAEGLAAVRKGDGIGYINASGDIIIDCKWEDAYEFSNDGLAVVANEDGKIACVNKTGEIVIPFGEWVNAFAFSDGYLRVQKPGSTAVSGFLNTSGELVYSGDWNYAKDDFHEGLAEVQQNGKIGFINTTGDLVVNNEWDDASIFSEGFAAVALDGKWGYINETGNIAISCEWDDAWPFYNGLAAVSRNGKYGFIDTSGTLVIPCEWDGVSGGFVRDYAFVRMGYHVYWIDRSGEVIANGGIDEYWYNFIYKRNEADNGVTFEKMAANCIEICKNMAKDPSSLQIHGIKYCENGDNYIFVLDVTGTNSFGGASRQTFACFVNPDTGTATYNSIISEISYSMYVGQTVDVSAAMALVK